MVIDFIYKWIIIPCIFLAIAIALSALYLSQIDPTPHILSVGHSQQNISKSKGKIISGWFSTTDDYLGSITLHFTNQKKINGYTIFKIRNKLQNDWYHTASISAEQYFYLPTYPFGLPIIENSKDQTYLFEIESYKNANGVLTLSDVSPSLISQYYYPRKILAPSFVKTILYMLKKYWYFLYWDDGWKVLLIYTLPLIIYFLNELFFHRSLSVEIKKIIRPFTLITFLLIARSILLFKTQDDNTILLLTLLWTLCIIFYRLNAGYSFGIAFIYFVYTPLFLFADMVRLAENSAIWSYIFMIIGTIHSIFVINNWSSTLSKLLPVKIILSFFNLFSNTVNSIVHIAIILHSNFRKTFRNRSNFLIYSAKRKGLKGWLMLGLKTSYAAIVISVIFLIIGILISYNFKRIMAEKELKTRLSLNPQINSIEPSIGYKSTKVIVYGKNFGWKEAVDVRLINDGQIINSDLWTDSKIIFTIPLDWRIGIHKIWVEKHLLWNEQKIAAKSQKTQLKVIPSSDKFTPDDEAFFNHLKKLSPEARKINGYD